MYRKLGVTLLIVAISTSMIAQFSPNPIIRFSPGITSTSVHPGPAAPSNMEIMQQKGYRAIFKLGGTVCNRLEIGGLYRYETTWGDIEPAYSASSAGIYSRFYFLKNRSHSWKFFKNPIIQLKPYIEVEAAISQLNHLENSTYRDAYKAGSWQSTLLSPSIGLDFSFNNSPFNIGLEMKYDLLIDDQSLHIMNINIPSPRLEFAYFFNSNKE